MIAVYLNRSKIERVGGSLRLRERFVDKQGDRLHERRQNVQDHTRHRRIDAARRLRIEVQTDGIRAE